LAQEKGASIMPIAAKIKGIFARAKENLQKLDKNFPQVSSVKGDGRIVSEGEWQFLQ